MTEYGIFNDEGLLEGQFYSRFEAEVAAAERYTADDEVVVDKVCPYHEDQRADTCEEC